MIEHSFQLVRGVGARRERHLWSQGIVRWSDLRARPLAASAALQATIFPAMDAAEAALARGDLPALARLFPATEHWRLYGAFAARAVYLDIETDEEGVTAIGLCDEGGPRILLAGRDVAAFPALVPADVLLVTYNGASFDVPVLRRAFPDWEPPAAHYDVRVVWARLGHHGGLKALEDAEGIGRPDHLRGLDGSAACNMWRHARLGDKRALRLFAEYNLYDTVNLRTLGARGYNRMIDKLRIPADPVHEPGRGDVLYDVSKILLAL